MIKLKEFMMRNRALQEAERKSPVQRENDSRWKHSSVARMTSSGNCTYFGK